MTIAERINLHKCGYSRAEIDALAAAEKEELETVEAEPAGPQEQPAEPAGPQEQPPEPAPSAPDRSADILAAINNLTAALQRQNVNTQQQPAPQQVTMTDIINSI